MRYKKNIVYLHPDNVNARRYGNNNRKKTAHVAPIIKAWNSVKGLDYSDKLELVTMIIESVQHANDDTMSMEQMLGGYPYKRYTKAELNAMLDEAEANFEAGRGIPDEEAWDDLEEELALQEEEQHEMAEML